MKTALIVCLLALAPIAASAQTRYPGISEIFTPDWGDASAKLNKGMTEQQVVKAVGYRPNKVEMKTCGQKSADGAWECKIYTYGTSPTNSLTVLFREGFREGDAWRVTSWFIYP